ncbi:MAG: VOC family protein, partial [Longimicrobiales bacterium]|nr:VOC family protein [Longimicrobiales bacterium]
IHHVAVRVTDLERSIAFYADLLGLAVRTRTTLATGVRQSDPGQEASDRCCAGIGRAAASGSRQSAVSTGTRGPGRRGRVIGRGTRRSR